MSRLWFPGHASFGRVSHGQENTMLLLIVTQKGGQVQYFVRMGQTQDDLNREVVEFRQDNPESGEATVATHVFDASQCQDVDSYVRLYLEVCLRSAIAVAKTADNAYTFTDFCLRAMKEDAGFNLQLLYEDLNTATRAMFEAWLMVRPQPLQLVGQLRKFGRSHGL